MKMRSRIILILIFWIITYINFAQVPWPLIPFNEQHNLAGTVGEYRNTGRLHRGVDILGPIDVYAVENGTVSLIQYPGESKEIRHSRTPTT